MKRKPSWKIRRRIIVSTLLFCAFCVLWVLIKGGDNGAHEVIVMCSFGLAFAVIGSYVFGAAWDDKNYMNAMTQQKATDYHYGQQTNGYDDFEGVD